MQYFFKQRLSIMPHFLCENEDDDEDDDEDEDDNKDDNEDDNEERGR